jgi:hypothetical protein
MRKNTVKKEFLKKTRVLGEYKLSKHIYEYISRSYYKRKDCYGMNFLQCAYSCEYWKYKYDE